MTKLLFLGSGSAFTVGADNFQSNLLLINDRGNKLLIDCGSDIRFSLDAAGFSYLDITDIYISHLHADHVGGLEFMGVSRKFDPRCTLSKIYISKELIADLWERRLSGGMRYISGDIASLDTYFKVSVIERDNQFCWENICFSLIRLVHIDSGYFIMPSYGLRFEVDGVRIFLTTDTLLRWELMQEAYEWADVVFQDCEILSHPTTVHAHYQELVQLPSTIKAKMWLYGYQPGELPEATNDGFLGFVKRGQVFDFINPITLTHPWFEL
ncbi:MAG: MBL fold metallo-hydrolase [Chloroflexaceae bacterium]|nr:MBL fold metallo-hydrolase [Chloroflexaceae bacterium]